jgi:hypothetical protein
MHWQSCGLPSDELAIQNAILLERFSRYPLIIDPSGQATAFILSKYRLGLGLGYELLHIIISFNLTLTLILTVNKR